jgi:hypothetical protein
MCRLWTQVRGLVTSGDYHDGRGGRAGSADRSILWGKLDIYFMQTI